MMVMRKTPPAMVRPAACPKLSEDELPDKAARIWPRRPSFAGYKIPCRPLKIQALYEQAVEKDRDRHQRRMAPQPIAQGPAGAFLQGAPVSYN